MKTEKIAGLVQMICFQKIICLYGTMHQNLESGDLVGCHLSLTHSQTDNFERESVAENMINMNGALVTQLSVCSREKYPGWCNLFETWD